MSQRGNAEVDNLTPTGDPALTRAGSPCLPSRLPDAVQVLQSQLVELLEGHAAGAESADVRGEAAHVAPALPRGQRRLRELLHPRGPQRLLHLRVGAECADLLAQD